LPENATTISPAAVSVVLASSPVENGTKQLETAAEPVVGVSGGVPQNTHVVTDASQTADSSRSVSVAEKAPTEPNSEPSGHRRKRGRRRRKGKAIGSDGRTQFDKGALQGKKLLLLNSADHGEVRAAVVEDGRLAEVFIERESNVGQAGNIYKGKVVGIEPSLQAAFVDVGGRRNGFLHVSDCLQPNGCESADDESSHHKRRHHSGGFRRVESLLHVGDEVLVQVLKEAMGQKGPALTMYLSLPGRYLVLMPGTTRLGVSKRIGDDEKRRELKRILAEIRPPDGLGVIVRTAGIDRKKEELHGDLQELIKLHSLIKERARAVSPGSLLYREAGVAVRVLRDFLTTDVSEIVIDSVETESLARRFLSSAAPWAVERLKLMENGTPLFEKFGVEAQMRRLFHRKVTLENGGSIIIEQTEALTTVDVNTGRCREKRGPHETILATNLAAAREIARQLRLRDIGGQVLIDFIDMDSAEHRRRVEQELRSFLARDKARLNILPISELGIVEMTRQRVRHSLRRTFFESCPLCFGAGHIRSVETLGFECLRELRRLGARCRIAPKSPQPSPCAPTEASAQPVAVAAADAAPPTFRVSLHPFDACVMLNKLRREITDLEETMGIVVEVVPAEGSARGILRIELAQEKGGWNVEYASEVDDYVRNS
jgi:ribonuclease E